MPLFGLLLVAVCILRVVAPQKVWRATEGWRYKHPEANEPSDTAYGFRRVLGVVMIGIGLWVMSIPYR